MRAWPTGCTSRLGNRARGGEDYMAAATAFMPPAYRPRKPAIVTAASFGVLMFLSGLVITGIQLFYTIHYLKAVAAKADVSLVAQLIPAWSRPFMVDLALV